MADQDIALAGDDAQVDDTAPPEAQQHELPAEDTPEPIANLARDLGWTPREEWQGEPDKWKPAEQFIRDGRDIQQATSKELRAVRDQLDRIGNATTSIIQDKVAERDAYWQQKFNQAVEDGDTEAARKLIEQRPTGQPQPQGPPPEVATWTARNPWFNSDPLAQARAKEISDRLAHLPVGEQLQQVERAIRKEFPEHFPAPAKRPPVTQTGASRTAAPGNRQKGFADMPADSQRVALDYEKRLGVNKDDFARSYWADKEGVKR